MVAIETVRASNAALIESRPLVAVFVGATSGIGEYVLKALARTHSDHGKGLRIYIVGRRRSAGDKVISHCRHLCPQGDFQFVEAHDLALIKDVDRVCRDITQLERSQRKDDTPRIDVLVMTQALIELGPRIDTKEGLDRSMSLLYYSRMRFILNLLPLLEASPLPAHVISVYAAGMEAKLFPDDLDLRDPKHYSFANCRSHSVYMKTMFMETLAQRYPGQLSLVHAYPGIVVTPAYSSSKMPLWFKVVWKVIGPLIAAILAMPANECGDRILFLTSSRYPARSGPMDGLAASEDGRNNDAELAVSTDDLRGGGAYAVNQFGDVVDTGKAYKGLHGSEFAKKVWDHTMNTLEAAEK